MIVEASPKIEALVERAKQFAALSGVFDPKFALPDSSDEDQATIVDVATSLAAACDTNPDEGEGWLLRTSVRRYILHALRAEGRLDQAIKQRRGEGGLDQETDDLLAAIAGSSPFGIADIQRDIDGHASTERLHRIVVALDRAGESAPGWTLLQTARSALAKTEREARRKHLRERGFFGRTEEQSKLVAFLATPNVNPPARAAFVSGLPGIGKSALIEEVAYQLTDRFNGLNVRIDFDRAGLDLLDIRGLTMEVARQLGERLGAAGEGILKKRLEAASYQPSEDASSLSAQSTFPNELADEMGRAVQASARPVLIVLDTLEVLRARGDEHPRKLFDWIDLLINAGIQPARIIAAGRGDALDSCVERIGETFRLDGLDTVATEQLLDRLGVAPRNRAAVERIADGNPLVLRLAGEIAREYGAKNLPSQKMEKEAVAGFLYRFLLSRIEDPQLRALANPGLVLRRISAGLLRDVLAPERGITGLNEKEAERLFGILAKEHWLVFPDPADKDFVIHRSDMRTALLPLLYADDPDGCARIDAAAVRWFAKRNDPQSELDAAYHRLQLMRRKARSRPLISQKIAFGFDPQMLAELPDAARDIVLRATGGRTSQFREVRGYSGQIDDKALAVELSNLVERQDWAEGQYLVRQVLDEGGFDARSVAASAVCAFYWRAGRWNEARRLLAERDQLVDGDEDLRELRQPIALARMEMRAEFGRPDELYLSIAREMAADTGSGALTLSRHGALGMRLRAGQQEDGESIALESGRGADPVAAAFENWTGQPGYAKRQALDIARERLAARGAYLADEGDWSTGQLLATHTPYAGVAANLATQEGYQWLAEDALAAEERFSKVDTPFGPSTASQASPTRSNPIAGLAGLGFFAEWIDLLGFLKRDSNLRAIGRSAERWRQTVAGTWRYGAVPRGWHRPGRLDATLAGRIDALRRAGHPVDAARIQLKSLLLADDDVDLVSIRLSASLERATETKELDEAADLLRRNRVPSALIPPFTILTHEHLFGPKSKATLTHEHHFDVGRIAMSNERLEAARSRMTEEMRARIARKVGEGSLPPVLLAAVSPAAVSDVASGAAPLEETVNVAALEAIIQRTGRPPLLIANDEVQIEEGDLDDFAAGTDRLVIGLNRFIPSVGRVEFLNHRMSWGGTAWVVEKKGDKYLMVTNRHVAALVAKRVAGGSAVFMRSAAGPRFGMNVDFAEEFGSVDDDDSRTVPISKIEYLADDLSADMAVLRVEKPGFDLSPVNLATRDAKKGERVAIIGYPAFDSRNDVNDQARYFRDLYEVKRLAPGLVMQSLSGKTTLTHDCTSLGGNSGSPLFELESGTVVGLHFSGLYGVENTAVGVDSIKKVLTGVSTQVATGTGKVEGLADGNHDAAHFKDRAGFDTSFLDNGKIKTPWPKLEPSLDAGLAQPSDGPSESGELRYTHFGVKYSEPHKLPLITAANIDGEKSVRIKRGDDKWFTDGRIKASIQLGAANFADALIDRGHMVRREDCNWGEPRVAQLANDDTFHYVNAAAQHSRLNQGKQLWQGLENYILDNARTHGFQACVFTGPVVNEDSEEIDGATVPMEFWKLVATLSADGSKLRATAYLLSQGQLIRNLMEERSRTEANEGVVLGEYRTFQISIADLAEATGYDFSHYEKADPLARGPEEAVDAMPRFLPLESPDDLVL